eukprot:TRINITY_DN4245_c0_g1_i1.p1 TRINITY_DN4245_c0_g1~~TRINITY_DN4245_c0_g1_i1.p1  ORF type:complete len:498 (-),score=136.81 TRINITY_DN4245_c0_g1_i1:219-1712(-)
MPRGQVGDHENPFRLPSDEEIFTLRESERRRKKEEREKQRSLRIEDKLKSPTRLASIRQLKEDSVEDEEEDSRQAKHIRLLPTLTEAAAANDRRREQENLAEFLQKKREMFLVQYSLGVKRDEMRKLEERAQLREAALRKKEKMLEEDATRFDAFLKENDMKAVEAIKRAETETKAKLDKAQDVKKLKSQIMTLTAEMSKADELLTDCKKYKVFLDNLTPREWLEQHRKKPAADERVSSRLSSLRIDDNNEEGEVSNIEQLDETEDIPMYFVDPNQLLETFAALEERNLFLIQNAQETEQALEDLKAKFSSTVKRMDTDRDLLNAEVTSLQELITAENEKLNALQTRAKFFQMGATGQEDQQKVLQDLNIMVEDVFQRTVGGYEGNLTTLDMLATLERKLDELLTQVEMMPSQYVSEAEKAKERDRRRRAREAKLADQKMAQEERVRRALERAKAPVKKKTGKPVMFRSIPKQTRKRKQDDNVAQGQVEDEYAYFFQ